MPLKPEGSLEQYVPEQDFCALLEGPSSEFFRLATTLLGAPEERWNKRVYYLIQSEAESFESFLDDYGARYNQTYGLLTELVASTRGFSLAGLSLEHLLRRVDGYGIFESMPAAQRTEARADLQRARAFVRSALLRLLQASLAEGRRLGVSIPISGLAHADFEETVVRFRLPRNLGTEAIQDEEQRIAEVASKYLQACTMLEEARPRRSASPAERDQLMAKNCTEELARVYEATVHNLQSAYDTHIKNTVIESGDHRLARLRGHVSASLHMLEAVTQLAHFVERHESELRDDRARRRLEEIVSRAQVTDVVVNVLLYWADRVMQLARPLAEELLPSYTTVQDLVVELDEGLVLHARPAALIVSIVNHHGTPVEMEIDGRRCNAGSILELLVVVGSNPEARRFVFRGDQHPLRDIGLLFQYGLGEHGIQGLPDALAYLRG